MHIIGLTGGIGSGKSTVATLFEQLGIDVIDTDIIARELVERDMPAYQEIVDHYGPDITDDNHNINRKKLRTIIFNDAEEKQWLENLLHPLIRETIAEQIKRVTSSYCIVVIPLLVESKPNPLINRVLVVDCAETLQRERVLQRDKLTETALDAIMESQSSRQNRLNIADDIIENNDDINSLKRSIKQLHETYLKLKNNN
jgi:dephospho-CoA kinase